MTATNGIEDVSPLSVHSIPKTDPPVGSLAPGEQPNAPLAFTPITIRGVTFKNRLWVAPMCQYSCKTGTGVPSTYHLVHLGQFALHGAGAIYTEASSVLANGRISPEDVGIWEDAQLEGHSRITDFEKEFGAVPVIQIAHAGRKASTYGPWHTDGLTRPAVPDADKNVIVPDELGGFRKDVFGPSAIAFDARHASPREMTPEDIAGVKQAFVDAAKRSLKAGYRVIELHGAHGYLFHEFCSPLSNKRTDQYGGSLENRIRLSVETAKAVREAIGEDVPLFYRISATDWHPEGEKNGTEYISWGEEQSALLCAELYKAGVDLIDVSSAGNDSRQQIKIGPGYQVGFAEHLKKNPSLKELKIGAVGLITTPRQAEDILQEGKADVIYLAREFLRDPAFVEHAAYQLHATISTLHEYERAHTRMYAKH